MGDDYRGEERGGEEGWEIHLLLIGTRSFVRKAKWR